MDLRLHIDDKTGAFRDLQKAGTFTFVEHRNVLGEIWYNKSMDGYFVSGLVQSGDGQDDYCLRLFNCKDWDDIKTKWAEKVDEFSLRHPDAKVRRADQAS